jgi:aspartyl protease family protein
MAPIDAMPGKCRGSRALRMTISRHALIIVGLLISAGAGATDIRVSGLFTNKALVQIDGGPLRTLSVGQKTPEGVVLVSVERDAATFEVEGKRITVGLGHARMATTAPAAESVVLTADVQGHFRTEGQVNGKPVRFVVDTGATLIALPAGEARRLSIDYQKGRKAMMRTANGNIPGYVVKLDTVSIGTVTIYDVDAVVLEGNGLEAPLLGMSFLNRMNMTREGDIMTLTRRY